jgi:hypothetical protein
LNRTCCRALSPSRIRCTRFWRGWLKWSDEAGIDYFIGRKVPGWLDSLGLEDVAGESQTAQFNGGSDWATYWSRPCGSWKPHCWNRVTSAKKCSGHFTPAIKILIIGLASLASQRVGDACQREARLRTRNCFQFPTSYNVPGLRRLGLPAICGVHRQSGDLKHSQPAWNFSRLRLRQRLDNRRAMPKRGHRKAANRH